MEIRFDWSFQADRGAQCMLLLYMCIVPLQGCKLLILASLSQDAVSSMGKAWENQEDSLCGQGDHTFLVESDEPLSDCLPHSCRNTQIQSEIDIERVKRGQCSVDPKVDGTRPSMECTSQRHGVDW